MSYYKQTKNEMMMVVDEAIPTPRNITSVALHAKGNILLHNLYYLLVVQ